MKRRILHIIVVLGALFLIPAVSFAKSAPAISIEKTQLNGDYNVQVHSDGKWVDAGKLSFDKHYSDKTVDIGKIISSQQSAISIQQSGKGTVPDLRIERSGIVESGLSPTQVIRVRLIQKGGGAAHIDSVFLGGSAPIKIGEAKDEEFLLKKLSKKDFDVIDVFGKTIELEFPANDGETTLKLTARVEATEISKTPFQFPLDNLYKQMTTGSSFYTYKLQEPGTRSQEPGIRNQGPIVSSQDSAIHSLTYSLIKSFTNSLMHRSADSPPFFKEFTQSGTGHPSTYTYGWVNNDNENLYVKIDFAGDNTWDGDKDYTKVYIKTDKGLKEFKVSEIDTKWGKPRFTYTDKVPYQHKVYEFKIPFNEIGMGTVPDLRTERSGVVESGLSPHIGKDLQLAFAAYGTLGPPTAGPPSPFNFGAIDVGNSSVQPFTVTNINFAAINIDVISIAGADAGDFSINNDFCSSNNIPGFEGCTLAVVFSPSSAGAKSATLVVPTDAGELDILLSGTANNPPPPSAVIGYSPVSLDFTAYTGGVDPSGLLDIWNDDAGVLNWTVSNATSWLTLNPTTGIGAGTVNVAVNSSDLPPGVYADTIQITDGGAINSPQGVPVSLDVIRKSWGVETIESGSVGRYSAMALDPNNKAHASYWKDTGGGTGHLLYANNTTGSWTNTIVDNSSSTNVGLYSSIAVDSAGKAHISYYDTMNGDLRYATNVSGAWTTCLVDGDGAGGADVGAYSSIALYGGDANISYYDVINSSLKYAKGVCDAWNITTVDNTGDSGTYSSIAVDQSGKAHISYKYVLAPAWVKYATNASGAWVTADVDSGNPVDFTDIAVDPAGKAHISFRSIGAPDSLVYATNVSGPWVSTVIDSGSRGSHSSIAVDGSAKAYISYYDYGNGNLKYATNKSGAWKTLVVDGDNEVSMNVGDYSSIALDDSNNPHITYRNFAAINSFKYAYYDNVSPTIASEGSSKDGIWAVFSERMDSSTIDSSTFIIEDAGGPMAGVISYDVPNKKVTFVPNPPGSTLANGSYDIAITSGVKDLAGNAIAASSWTETINEPAIGYSQSSFVFTFVIGGPNPSPQTFTFSNTGGGALGNWNVMPMGGSGIWLTASPANGNDAGPAFSGDVMLTPDFTNWTPPVGNNIFSLDIFAENANPTSVSLPITLTVSNPTLNISKAGTGTGTVSSDPAGLACGGSCSASFDSGTSVVLSQIASVGSSFAGWSGDADCADGIVTIGGNINCTATFNSEAALAVTKSGTGSGRIKSLANGIDCAGSCTSFFDPAANTAVTLTAVADPGSTFTGWHGACSGTGSCIVTMSSSRDVYATFICEKTLGGVPTEGNLMISSLDDGSIGVYRFIDGQWQNQIFDWASKGSRLMLNGAGYSLSKYGGSFDLTGSAPVLVSNARSGNRMTTIWNAGSIGILQDVTYNPGNSYFGLKWVMTNNGPSAAGDLRFFHGEDTYSFGLDTGAGYWDAPNYTIGVQKNIGGEMRRMSLQGVTVPDAHGSESYSTIKDNIDAGALTNIVDGNESVDNGYALEWRKNTLAPGEAWTILAYEKFIDVPVGVVSITAPTITECNNGSSCNLAFTVINTTGIDKTVRLISGIDVADSGWVLNIQLADPDNVIIPANGSKQVTLIISLPPGASNGIIGSASLYALVGGGIVASDIAAVKAVQLLHIVTPSAGSGGSISPNTSASINHNSTASFAIIPNSGYYIASVTGCNGLLSGSTYTTGPVTTDCTVTATFAVSSFTLTVGKAGTGSGTVSGAGTYGPGNSATVAASPDANSVFTGWGGDCSGTGSSTTVTMNGNKTCTANFIFSYYSLNVTKTGQGTISLSPPGSVCSPSDSCYKYYKGQKLTLIASPEAGYIFKNWNGACSGTSACQLSMTGDKAVSAVFEAVLPKISVSSDGIDLVNETAYLDFGQVRIGRLKTKTIKVKNNGKGNLTISSGIEGTDADMFSRKMGSRVTIRPGKSYNIRIRFKPSSTDAKSAELIINSNDPDLPSSRIDLGGKGFIRKK